GLGTALCRTRGTLGSPPRSNARSSDTPPCGHSRAGEDSTRSVWPGSHRSPHARLGIPADRGDGSHKPHISASRDRPSFANASPEGSLFSLRVAPRVPLDPLCRPGYKRRSTASTLVGILPPGTPFRCARDPDDPPRPDHPE